MWKVILVVLGAAVGYVGMGLVEPWIHEVGFAIGWAVFAGLGFWWGCVLDRRERGARTPQKWRGTFVTLGAALGSGIGYFVGCYIIPPGRSEVHGPVDVAARLMLGVPVGAILFCLLGLCLGSVLDGRSRRNGPPHS
jgi:hypothetical protein